MSTGDGTIVRLWRGRVAASSADEYRDYQKEVGPPNYRTMPGIRRIYMLERELGAQWEVAMLTFWESLEAIRAFVGEPIDRANYDEYRRRGLDFLIELPETVEHFDVLVRESPSVRPQDRPDQR